MVNHQFSKDRKDELEKVITQRSWKIDLALAHFEGPHEKVKAEGRQGERSRTWGTCLYWDSRVEYFGGSWAEAG